MPTDASGNHPMGGCGLGVGLAVGIEQLTPTFKRREEVEMLPGIRVLAAIPNFAAMHLHLNESENGLVCETCKLLYEIREDIPIMLIEEAKPIET